MKNQNKTYEEKVKREAATEAPPQSVAIKLKAEFARIPYRGQETRICEYIRVEADPTDSDICLQAPWPKTTVSIRQAEAIVTALREYRRLINKHSNK